MVRMITSMQYLMFANEADMNAETDTDPMLREHFLRMAKQWRRLVDVEHERVGPVIRG